MPDFRRYYIPDAIVFITVVTDRRIPYLQTEQNIQLYWSTLKNVQSIHPFHLLAYVILPDHFHWLMQTSDLNGDFSTVLHSFKRNYTLNYKKSIGINGELKLWQARFWDHLIRDEKDLKQHFDYIHWNPVKHGYVAFPEAWQESTYCHWQAHGYYETGWGVEKPPQNIIDMNLD